MKPSFDDVKIVYLHPGEVIYAKKPMVVSTVLGSCLSVIMYNPRTKIAGISHCQLPICKEHKEECSDCTDPYKYVDCTIRKMLEKFEELTINKNEIEIKIFGGGDVLSPESNSKNSNTIGKQNIESAMKLIMDNKLILKAEDTGGMKGRKIFFHTGTGEVYLNRLKNYEED